MPIKPKPKIERIRDLTTVIKSEDFWKSTASKLACGGVSYFIGLIIGPASIFSSQVTDYAVHKLMGTCKSFESDLFEILLGKHSERKFRNVGEFWTGVQKERLEQGAIIEVSGLLSPYAPFIPAHPMSRPGYTIEGWELLGELETEDTEEYDVRDGIIYGDRVVRLSKTRNKKYYAGLYNHDYGISNISIPLLVDSSIVNKKKSGLSNLWKDRFTRGRFVKLKGNLIKILNFYSTFINQVPEKYRNLPSYALEVGEIIESYEPKGVTHIAISVSWQNRKREEKMLTHYFNVQDLDQLKLANELIDVPREKHEILFDYDDLRVKNRMRKKIPEYNELLRDWLE